MLEKNRDYLKQFNIKDPNNWRLHLGGEATPDIERPKGYWAKPENIEREGWYMFDQHGSFSYSLLRHDKRLDLATALSRRYAGGLDRLLYIYMCESTERYSQGSYMQQRVLEEARKFHESEGTLNHETLIERGRWILDSRLLSYPGGERNLHWDLGIGDFRDSFELDLSSLEGDIAILDPSKAVSRLWKGLTKYSFHWLDPNLKVQLAYNPNSRLSQQGVRFIDLSFGRWVGEPVKFSFINTNDEINYQGELQIMDPNKDELEPAAQIRGLEDLPNDQKELLAAALVVAMYEVLRNEDIFRQVSVSLYLAKFHLGMEPLKPILYSPDQIEQVVRMFCKGKSDLTKNSLDGFEDGLLHITEHRYPGGFWVLKEKIKAELEGLTPEDAEKDLDRFFLKD